MGSDKIGIRSSGIAKEGGSRLIRRIPDFGTVREEWIPYFSGELPSIEIEIIQLQGSIGLEGIDFTYLITADNTDLIARILLKSSYIRRYADILPPREDECSGHRQEFPNPFQGIRDTR